MFNTAKHRGFCLIGAVVLSTLIIAAGAIAADAAPGATISLEKDGFAIATPADGRLLLAYPAMQDKAQQFIKPGPAAVKGDAADIDYPQGVKLRIERRGGSFTLHFTGVTEAITGFRMEMTLPGDFKNGAQWQYKGGQPKALPTDFADEQFVFKGNPQPTTLTTPHGAVFTLSFPYGWQQMQDGRKWNSANFDYMFATAMPHGGGNEAWFSFKLWSGGADKEPAEPKAKPAPVRKAEPPRIGMHLSNEGLSIEAGMMGHFTVTYPVFVGDRWDDVRKPIEKNVSGNTATIKFDNDARIDLAWQSADGTLTLTPVNVPASVRHVRMTMLIDFKFSNGGTWKIGQAEPKSFPAEKPASPHIFQGEASSFVLQSLGGATLSLDMPEHSFQQLTDSREWGWKAFHLQFEPQCSAGSQPIAVKVKIAAGSGKTPKLVDRFGQSAIRDFPAKVKSEDELKQDVQTEASWAASLQPPTFDPFGGLPDSGQKLGLQRAGFFHVEKKNDRWLLVDPAGNAIFHLGVCGMQPSDDYTHFAGREDIYEWLPERGGQFKTAYHPDHYWNSLAISFHVANCIRKYGQPYDLPAYTARTIERLRKWGFNGAGAFGAGDIATRKAANFAYPAHLPLSQWEGFPDIPGAHGIFDPFSEKMRQHCDEVFAKKLPAAADDPLIIGYYLANEPLLEQIPGAVAAMDGSHPCKRELAKMLEEKYKTIDAFNAAWQTNIASFADVAARGLPVKNAAAKEDMQTFTGLFLDAYFRLVCDTFRKYDKNHMLIGDRLQPNTIKNETLCRLSGKYMDIVSFNYYTYGLDAKLLEKVHGWIGDKPMLFSEFFYSSPSDSGLVGGNDVSSQRERGLAYRQYVEQAAALGYVVGIEWFTLIDQATSGRFFEKYNGESANSGLISVTDRPWKDMLAEMIKTNYDIYPVYLGQRAPFVFDDARFKPKAEK